MIELKNWPTNSKRITSPYGPRGSSFHDGVDIGAVRAGVEGDNIYAVADGVVSISKVNGGGVNVGYGYYIVIRHNGFSTLYGHLQGLMVKVGQRVKAGEIVGKMGNTGSSTAAHLHFRLVNSSTISFAKLRNGNTVGSVDPMPYLRKIDEVKVPPTPATPNIISPWAREAYQWVTHRDNKISDGTRPKDPVTREEVWVMEKRVYDLVDKRLKVIENRLGIK